MKKRDLLNDVNARTASVRPLPPPFPENSEDATITDRFNSAADAMSQLYPFLWSGSECVTEAEREQYDGLFAWLAESLVAYPVDGANPRHCLPQLFATASRMECEGRLWRELSQVAHNVSPKLIADIADIVRTCRVDGIEILERSRYGGDSVPKILNDIAAKDWKSLHWLVQHCWHDFWLPMKQQACAALYHLDRSSLQAFFEHENDFFEVTTFVLHAPVSVSLDLATACGNWTLKFWAAFHSAQHATAGKPAHPSAWRALLSEAALSPGEWSRWLAVFNEYPHHYPQLQDALGDILPTISGDALDAYISTIASSEMSRQQVGTTLAHFSECAPTSQRHRVWTAAYKRWQQWDFGSSEQSGYVVGVKRSAFDFAVIGYFAECLDASGRLEWSSQLRKRAKAIDSDWHADITVPSSERFKLISSYQLVAHAEEVGAASQYWLVESPLYRPDWEDGTLYRALKYEQPFSQPTFLDAPEH